MKLIDREIVTDVLKRLVADVCAGEDISAIDVLSEINDVVLEAPYMEVADNV